jgi:hypothetical protein
LTVTPSSLTLEVGETRTLQAGNNVGPLTWYSANEAVAKVARTNVSATTVTAVGPGTAIIYVSDQSTKGVATCTVTVTGGTTPTPTPTPTLTVAPSTLSLEVGKTETLTATNYTGNVEWLADDPSIATVEGSGSKATVTGVKIGATKITVLDDSGAEAMCAVTVTETAASTLDSDGDGILDVNEVNAEAINTPVGMFTMNEGVLPDLYSIFNDTRMADYLVAPGDTLWLNGKDITFSDFTNVWIIIRNEDSTYLRNIKPDGTTDYGLSATLPTDAVGKSIEIFVVKDNQRTLSIYSRLVSKLFPVLHSVYQVGDNILEIEGLNLDKATTLALNKARIPLRASTPNKIQVNIPNGLKSGYAWLIGGEGDSNFVTYKLNRIISGTFTLPGIALDRNKITVSQNFFQEVPVDGSGKFSNLGIIADAGMLHVFYEGPKGENALIAQAVVLEDETNPTIDFKSTAIALIWNAVDILSIEPGKIKQLYSDIAAEDKVASLAEYLRSGLATKIDLLSDWTPELKTVFEAAAASVADIFEQKYYRSSSKANALRKQNISPTAVETPTITPDAKWSLDFYDTIVRYEEFYPGEIFIRNDTELQLLYEVRPLNDLTKVTIPYDMSRKISNQTKAYETGWFGFPDGKTPSYWATERRIDLKGVSSRVQIMTDATDHGKFSPAGIPQAFTRQYFRLVGDGIAMNMAVPLFNMISSTFFSQNDVKKILGDELNAKMIKLIADEIYTNIAQLADSSLMNESLGKWNQDSLKATMKKIQSAIPGIAETILKKYFGEKAGFVQVLEKFNLVMKITSLVKESVWLIGYMWDSSWNDSLIDFEVVFPDNGTAPPTNGNWIDVADISWYNPSDTELTIFTDKELAGLAKLTNINGVSFRGKTIHLGDDIDLAGKNWTPVKSFNGTFNGENKLISNLVVTNGKGLFETIDAGGKISNLNMSNVYVSSKEYDVGGLAGILKQATIENCSVHGKVNGVMSVGLVAGTTYGDKNLVWNCTVSGNVTGSGRLIGGVVGSNYSLISSCKSYAIVQGSKSPRKLYAYNIKLSCSQYLG